MSDPADDRLAPVTSLFGRRDGRGGEPTPESASDSWAAETEPGDDEIEPGPAETAVEPRDEAGASRPVLTALPTYAAFAATTEPELADSAMAESIPVETGAVESEPVSSEAETEDLAAATARAENISLHALSRRGVSSRELETTLRARELPDEVVLAEIERLERVGLLDDYALAENLVQTKQDRKGMGKSAISGELRQRGIAQEAIDAALADIDDDEEQARADEWAEKRSGQLRGLDQATAERRLNAFLMRRGYRSEVVRRAVEKALPRGGGGGVRFR